MKNVVFGLEGETLLKEEKEFFEWALPFGFILFERNCENPSQLKTLIESLNNLKLHQKPHILIDQEGGRVQRLAPPEWPFLPSARTFGLKAETNLKEAGDDCYQNAFKSALELKNLGITVNCAPCLDLFIDTAHPVIGERAFSDNPAHNAFLGKKVIEGFRKGGIISVIKHLPGHGRATDDSHQKTPIVKESFDQLNASDFEAFRLLCQEIGPSPDVWGMTAHVIFSNIDNKIATCSKKVIQTIIRKTIGFKGLLLSDCLTMKGLGHHSMRKKAEMALEAGCEILLYCGTIFSEREQVVQALKKEYHL